MKAMNDRPVAPAMMMFGGSPISVAVPPMFETRISMMTSGSGSMSERVGQEERDRHHQQDSGEVVQERRQHRGGRSEREHNRERLSA